MPINTVECGVLVMLAAYYVDYPCVVQSLVLDESYVNATKTKSMLPRQETKAGFRGSYRQRRRGGWVKCQEDDSVTISCMNYHNEHIQPKQLMHTRVYVVAPTWFGILHTCVMLPALHFNIGVHLIRSINVRATIAKVFISKCSSVWRFVESWPQILWKEDTVT